MAKIQTFPNVVVIIYIYNELSAAFRGIISKSRFEVHITTHFDIRTTEIGLGVEAGHR